ncbi:hypothetical protein JXL21_07665 [Candidatus Bathyarchaeota archaeon]|nr:hypothetical protein [Candidatus Bathyarchaeota archaeon]
MNEKEAADKLQENWRSILEVEDPAPLTAYLTAYSNLPGPRANLALAYKVGELLTEGWSMHRGFLLRCLDAWAHSGDEYLLTVRNVALGYILSENDAPRFEEILYRQNFHPMWRPREAVTLGLQRTLAKCPEHTLSLLTKWNESGELIVLRNTLMVLAEPSQLETNKRLRDELREYIRLGMDRVRTESAENRRGDGYKLLKKSLGFVISVAAAHDGEVIGDIEQWAGEGVPAWRSILRQNLKMKRFRTKYPRIAEELLSRLG